MALQSYMIQNTPLGELIREDLRRGILNFSYNNYRFNLPSKTDEEKFRNELEKEANEKGLEIKRFSPQLVPYCDGSCFMEERILYELGPIIDIFQ